LTPWLMAAAAGLSILTSWLTLRRYLRV